MTHQQYGRFVHTVDHFAQRIPATRREARLGHRDIRDLE
jgi:hypothetical protein